MKRTIGIAFAALVMPLQLISTAALAQGVAAPTGWSDAQSGDKRVLAKDGITIEVGPWQSASGSSTCAWLKAQERRGVPDISYVSTQRLQAEKAISGSYSLLRNVQVNGRDQISVLYACRGKDGSVKLMELRGAVTRQNAAEITRGAKFGEEVCAGDPNVASAASRPSGNTIAKRPERSSSAIGRPAASSQSLAAANAQIPSGPRPQSVRIALTHKWVGFPAVRVSKAVPLMRFANGCETACTKWNPMTQSPTPGSAGRIKRCEVGRGDNAGKPAKKFRPGETIDISFGRITGASRLANSMRSRLAQPGQAQAVEIAAGPYQVSITSTATPSRSKMRWARFITDLSQPVQTAVAGRLTMSTSMVSIIGTGRSRREQG